MRACSLGIAALACLLAVTLIASTCEAVEVTDGSQMTLSGTYDRVYVAGYAWGNPPGETPIRSTLTVNAPLTLTDVAVLNPPLQVSNYGLIVMNASITAASTLISPVGSGWGDGVEFRMNSGTLTTYLDWSTGTVFKRNGGHLALSGFNTTGADHTLNWLAGDTISGRASFGYSATLHLLSDFQSPNLEVYRGAQVTRDTARYQVGTMYITTNTGMTFEHGDAISNLSLSDSSTLISHAGLAVNDIYVYSALLSLTDFTSHISAGTGSMLEWGLRVAGDNRNKLTDYLAQGLVTATNNSQPVSVVYSPTQFGDYTYVGYIAAVPEIDPSSFGSAFALLIGSLGWMERRRLKSKAS